MTSSAVGQPPDVRPIGPVWREVRLEVGATQAQVGEILGLAHGQVAVSYREKDPSAPKAVEPSPAELALFEDRFGLQRGTVLRRAGYVVDAESPLEQIDSWSFLNPSERQLIREAVEKRWIEAGRPGARKQRRASDRPRD